MFWVRIILHFAFSLIAVSMFSMESSAPGSLPSISCILFLMLASMVPDFFLRVSIYRVVSLWVSFIISTSIFRSWMDLFNSITSLVVFPCNSLRDFCVSSLRSSTCVAVISYNSLRDSLCFLFKGFYLFSGVLLNFFKWVINALLNILYQHHEMRFQIRILLFRCVGVFETRCGGRTGFWWCPVVLVSVRKILSFAFRHLVVFGVRCSSCLWLKLVPPVFFNPCQHSWETNSLLCPSGQNTLCRQALLLQRRCTEVWSSDPPPDSWGQSPPWRPTPLSQGKCLGFWVLGLSSGWGWRPVGTLFKKLSYFCCPLTLLHKQFSVIPRFWMC